MHTPSVLFENHDISLLSAFKTRAIAAYYFEVHTREDIGYLSEIFAFSEQKKIPMMVIGSGTNCLFAFDRYEGILIRNKYAGHGAIEEKDGKKVITVKSGELSTTLAIDLAQKHETQTLVPWVGLPGTMGGALIGNAGCFGLEMSDILIEAYILDLTTDEVRTYSRADMQYAYRESVLK
jgi:UDP-N-acetylmuramate dehydrogenase